MSRRHEDRRGGPKPRGKGAGRSAGGARSGGPKSRGKGGERSAGGAKGGGPKSRGKGGERSGGGAKGGGPKPYPLRKPKPTRRRRGLVVKPSRAELPDDGKVRLNRYLAMSGVCSRRSADQMIETGRVTVNGEVVTVLGQRIDPQGDEVRFDGSRIKPEKLVYVLLNKPKGVVCTSARYEQKTRVIDLLPGVRGRIYTVGRLDADSEGLLLLTNDGDFALRMTHPRYGMPKTYSVVVRGHVGRETTEKARGGVWLAEGRTGGAHIKIERAGPKRTFLKVEIREGKNREIRRVFAKLDHPVIALKRVRIGQLTLHGLGEGKYRFLTLAEVQGLLADAAGEGGAE